MAHAMSGSFIESQVNRAFRFHCVDGIDSTIASHIIHRLAQMSRLGALSSACELGRFGLPRSRTTPSDRELLAILTTGF
jgi:hypothetical protein